MDVLIIEPLTKPYVKEIKSDLASMQKIVDGYIEVVYPFEDEVGLICNEEGKLNGLLPNRPLKDENGQMYDIIYGTFFIAGLSEDNFRSLTKEERAKFQDYFTKESLPVIVAKQCKDRKNDHQR